MHVSVGSCGVDVFVWSGSACVEWKWLCGVEVAVTSEYACVEGIICTLEVVQCVV